MALGWWLKAEGRFPGKQRWFCSVAENFLRNSFHMGKYGWVKLVSCFFLQDFSGLLRKAGFAVIMCGSRRLAALGGHVVEGTTGS